MIESLPPLLNCYCDFEFKSIVMAIALVLCQMRECELPSSVLISSEILITQYSSEMCRSGELHSSWECLCVIGALHILCLQGILSLIVKNDII